MGHDARGARGLAPWRHSRRCGRQARRGQFRGRQRDAVRRGPPAAPARARGRTPRGARQPSRRGPYRIGGSSSPADPSRGGIDPRVAGPPPDGWFVGERLAGRGAARSPAAHPEYDRRGDPRPPGQPPHRLDLADRHRPAPRSRRDPHPLGPPPRRHRSLVCRPGAARPQRRRSPRRPVRPQLPAQAYSGTGHRSCAAGDRGRYRIRPPTRPGPAFLFAAIPAPRRRLRSGRGRTPELLAIRAVVLAGRRAVAPLCPPGVDMELPRHGPPPRPRLDGRGHPFRRRQSRRRAPWDRI